jgi:hypothetical protein
MKNIILPFSVNIINVNKEVQTKEIELQCSVVLNPN